jgi:hypothetical protein
MKVLVKPKPPQGLSYVLKSSLLEAALEQAKITCQVDLTYGCGEALILRAWYWVPSSMAPYPRVYVQAGVVPSSQRKAAADALGEKVLPAFVAWLSKILALPDNSTAWHGRLVFEATFSHGIIKIAQ